DAGLILRTPGSVLFVIPWGGHWIIGTTDTDWTLDRAHPAASASDIEYLLGQVNQVLDRPLSTSDIEGVYAGLRPLLSAEAARRHGVSVGVAEHLLERYGTLTPQLLGMLADDPTLARPVAGAPEYLAAEVAYAALAESALHLDDVLTRRTRISIETAHRGVESAEDAALVLGRVLGWDAVTRRREIDHYLARVAAERE